MSTLHTPDLVCEELLDPMSLLRFLKARGTVLRDDWQVPGLRKRAQISLPHVDQGAYHAQVSFSHRVVRFHRPAGR